MRAVFVVAYPPPPACAGARAIAAGLRTACDAAEAEATAARATARRLALAPAPAPGPGSGPGAPAAALHAQAAALAARLAAFNRPRDGRGCDAGFLLGSNGLLPRTGALLEGLFAAHASPFGREYRVQAMK